MKFIIDKMIKYSTLNFIFVSGICYIETKKKTHKIKFDLF
jgi:hypothetical protein